MIHMCFFEAPGYIRLRVRILQENLLASYVSAQFCVQLHRTGNNCFVQGMLSVCYMGLRYEQQKLLGNIYIYIYITR